MDISSVGASSLQYPYLYQTPQVDPASSSDSFSASLAPQAGQTASSSASASTTSVSGFSLLQALLGYNSVTSLDPSLMAAGGTNSATGADSTTAATGAPVQGAGGGHHHHHKSISKQVSSLEDEIDKAEKSGSMTSDQATTLKNELSDVTQTLGQSQTGTSQTGAATATTGTQLSDDDRKKISGELQDVRSQLRSAMNPQGITSAASSDQVNNLFTAMDINGDGSVGKDEFSSFLNSLVQNSGYFAQGGGAQSAAAPQTTFSAMA